MSRNEHGPAGEDEWRVITPTQARHIFDDGGRVARLEGDTVRFLYPLLFAFQLFYQGFWSAQRDLTLMRTSDALRRRPTDVLRRPLLPLRRRTLLGRLARALVHSDGRKPARTADEGHLLASAKMERWTRSQQLVLADCLAGESCVSPLPLSSLSGFSDGLTVGLGLTSFCRCGGQGWVEGPG